MALNEEALQALKSELLEELTQDAPNKARLAERLAEIRSADIGEVLEELIEEDDALSAALAVLAILSAERAANVLGYLPKESQLEVVGELTDTQVLKLLEEMGSDERADLFNLLGEDRREALLRRMAHQEREDLKRLASYEEGTAGAIMTSDYVAIASGMTVSQAMMRVRQTAPDAETV
ncbi:MAG TPA: magnesium transporter, partial [Halomonas sp.]|nr:magnesium transporter [Halomonas sp.]